MTTDRRYHATVRSRRRALLALVPAALAVLVTVAPAAHPADGARQIVRSDTTRIRDVEAALVSTAAAVAERVAVPSIWPVHAPAPARVAALAALAWIGLLVVAAFMLRGAGLTRRERAPPRSGGLVSV